MIEFKLKIERRVPEQKGDIDLVPGEVCLIPGEAGFWLKGAADENVDIRVGRKRESLSY